MTVSSVPDPELREETVDALLENVRRFLEAEDRRSESFIGRASGLAAFAGLIVSLSAFIGRDLLISGIGGWLEGSALVLYGFALVALIATIASVVAGVLWPRSVDTIALEEIERYPFPEFVYQRKVMVQGRTMRGLIVALTSERSRNDRKARWLKVAYAFLTTALFLVAVASATLGVDAALADN
jgi:hypothetical protein